MAGLNLTQAGTRDLSTTQAPQSGLWLGIDGGATHSRGVLVDGGGRIVWRGEAGPFNHLAGEAGVERMHNALSTLVEAMPAAGRSSLAGLAVAMTGVTIPGKPALVLSLAADLLPAAACRITSDLAAAVWGAGGGQDAMILLCGTGSGAVALRQGEIVRSGAHGSEFGDEGSAYWIAQAGVRAALKAADGRAAPSALGDRLAAAAGLAAVTDIPRRAYAEAWPSGRVAALAPIVAAAAAAGDPAALAILDEAGAELGEAAVALRRRSPTRLRLSLMGGGWNLSPRLWQAAKERIRVRLGEDVEAEPPVADAALGAVLWARAGAPCAV